jgi:hypothetical protein
MDDGASQLVIICIIYLSLPVWRVLEVVDIAFGAMDERLEFYLKRHSDAADVAI